MPHHPWRRFADLTDCTLEWDDLPDGTMGLTCHRTKTVTLAKGMDQAERRCTIAHETEHVMRGPVSPHHELQEELWVDRRVSRLLLPSMREVVDALAWAHGHIEPAAAELWVDPFMFEVRLSALHAREREYLSRRLDEVLL
jgi:hypothetical protein